MKKYDMLFEIAKKDWGEFTLISKHLSADQLGYQKILEFLKSGDSNVRNGARSLLEKFSADQLDYQKILEFLKSEYPNVRNGARSLLEKHFPDQFGGRQLKQSSVKLLKMFG